VTKTATTVGTCSATVTVTATDECGNSASTSYSTRIDNTPPTVTAGSIATCYPSAAAAESAAIAATTATDNCPGTVSKTATTVGTCSATVTVTATDQCGNSASTSYSTRIDNTPPVLSGCPAATLTVQCVSDVPAAATVTANDNCDGTVAVSFNETSSGPDCNKTITRTWTASDSCGNTTSCTQTITVQDTTPPVLTGCPAPTLTVQCPNPVPPPATVTANDTCGGALIPGYSQTTVGSGCTQTITRTWTATDSCGNSSSCTQTITVTPAGDNQGPPTTNPLANPNPAAKGTNVVITATVSDATTGGNNVASAFYSVDGGPYLPMYPQDGAFNSVTEVVTVTNTFAAAGVYNICIYGIDSVGNIGPTNCDLLIAVYDPSAGFVTGGGWFNSPPGAYGPDPTAYGKANFGFVSKYQKGAAIPTGEAEFQFKAGNLNFHSDAYEWLVVSGFMAQYKGNGTINGVAGYTFLLTATDGQITGGGGVDKLRMKIWNTSTSVVVYDNLLSPDGDKMTIGNTQPIDGGSIMIKTK